MIFLLAPTLRLCPPLLNQRRLRISPKKFCNRVLPTGEPECRAVNNGIRSAASSKGEDTKETTWRPPVALSGVTCVKGWPLPIQLGGGAGNCAFPRDT